MFIVIFPPEDIGETHFGGFLKRKRPRVDKDDPEEVSASGFKLLVQWAVKSVKASIRSRVLQWYSFGNNLFLGGREATDKEGDYGRSHHQIQGLKGMPIN